MTLQKFKKKKKRFIIGTIRSFYGSKFKFPFCVPNHKTHNKFTSLSCMYWKKKYQIEPLKHFPIFNSNRFLNFGRLLEKKNFLRDLFFYSLISTFFLCIYSIHIKHQLQQPNRLSELDRWNFQLAMCQCACVYIHNTICGFTLDVSNTMLSYRRRRKSIPIRNVLDWDSIPSRFIYIYICLRLKRRSWRGMCEFKKDPVLQYYYRFSSCGM